MKKLKIKNTLSYLLDILGLCILIFIPVYVAIKLESLVFLLLYLIIWIPAGCLFGLAGFLIEKENKDE